MWRCGADHRRSLVAASVTASIAAIAALGFGDEDERMLAYVVALTLDPASMRSSHVEALRDVGYTELEIHDVVMVVACFSFMNRLADGTGVMLKSERYELAKDLFGEEALHNHLAWGRASNAT